MNNTSERSPFNSIGGLAGVRKLVDRFYDLMDEKTAAAIIRDMHPQSLDGSRQKLYEFLCGFLGGPALYIEKHGHPRLRMRHAGFAIDESARDNWIACMNQALEEQVSDKIMLMQLKSSFYRTADHLINVQEKSDT